LEYDLLSFNDTLTYKILKKHNNIIFNYDSISEVMNINELNKLYNDITYSHLINNYFLCRNKTLTIKDINKFGKLNNSWNIKDLSLYQNITMDFIKENKNLYWNYDNISLNPNITIEFIKENINKINFNNLSSNKLNFIKYKYLFNNKYKTIYKTKKIEEELIIKT
jgi:hypothetical protein